MKPAEKALWIALTFWALLGVLVLTGCAAKPIPAPSTAAVSGDIQRAQTATSQADAKAAVILQYLQSAP